MVVKSISIGVSWTSGAGASVPQRRKAAAWPIEARGPRRDVAYRSVFSGLVAPAHVSPRVTGQPAVTMGWSWRLCPTPGRSVTTSMPRAASSSAGPMPDSMSRCGVRSVPAHRTTEGDCAMFRRPSASVYSTPVTARFWITTRRAVAPVRTVRPVRCSTGWR